MRALAVSIDGGLEVMTDGNGRFRAAQVAPSAHRVSIAAQLPAEYDPEGRAEIVLFVEPQRTVRAQFTVVRLTSFSGRVKGPKDTDYSNAAIRLLPGNRYTTPNNDGNFAFYDLREGDYQVVLDEKTLPENGGMKSPALAAVEVRVDRPAEPIAFEFEIRVPEKPIRKVIDQRLNLTEELQRQQNDQKQQNQPRQDQAPQGTPPAPAAPPPGQQSPPASLPAPPARDTPQPSGPPPQRYY